MKNLPKIRTFSTNKYENSTSTFNAIFLKMCFQREWPPLVKVKDHIDKTKPVISIHHFVPQGL